MTARPTAWQDYGERMYDPRLARFPSSDPLIVYGQKYVELTPYQFASNTPIWAIDLDGLEKFNIHMRAFAPWKSFGSLLGQEEFAGDNRGFSLSSADKIKSKVSYAVSIDLDKWSSTDLGDAISSPSKGPDFNSFPITDGSRTGKPRAFHESFWPDGGSFYSPEGNKSSLYMSVAASNPLVWFAPAIDWGLSLTFENKINSISISGVLKGDGFPAAEAFIEDASGQRAFLTTFAPPDKSGVKDRLFGDFGRFEANINLNFSLDSNGNFLGVTDNASNKSYSLDAWNSKHTSKKAAGDL
jgi:RHS repeat-associated protein